MKKQLHWSILLLLLFAFVGCSDNDTINPGTPDIKEEGVYVLSEGSFGKPTTSSLSFYEPSSNEVTNDVFKNANKDVGSDGLILGNTPQSMTLEGSLIHIIINGDNKIITIDGNTNRYLGEVKELTSPRYMVTTPDHRAYVTSLAESKITIVDLVQKEFDEGKILSKIDVSNPEETRVKQHTSERVIAVNDELFVAAWSYDETILVVDPKTNTLKEKITVGVQPQSMALDKNKMLWVLCDGSYNGSPFKYSDGSIHRINTQTHKDELVYTFPKVEGFATKKNLVINRSGDTIYFINKDIYRMKITDSEPEKIIEAKAGQVFYALGIDPKNGDIYVGDAVDYSQPGMVYRYGADLQKKDEFKVGVNPSSFLFFYN